MAFVSYKNVLMQPQTQMTYAQLQRWVEIAHIKGMKPLFKSIKGLNMWVTYQQQMGYDYTCLILGRRGSGKSTVAYKIAKEHNRYLNAEHHFNVRDSIVFSGIYEEYLKKYELMQKGAALVVDEAGKLFFRMDFMSTDAKNVQKMWIADIRKDKKPWHILCVPDAQNLMKFWREFETNMIIFCPPRWWFKVPRVFVFELSNVVGKNETAELLDRIYKVSGTPKQIKRQLFKDKFFSGLITIRDLKQKQRERYALLREKELAKYNAIQGKEKAQLKIDAVKRYIIMYKFLDYLHKLGKTYDGLKSAGGGIYSKELLAQMIKLCEQYEFLQHNKKVTPEQVEQAKNVFESLNYG